MEQQCPGVVRQIEQDRGRTGPLPFWGRSKNVDEFEASTIVAPSILELIAVEAGVKMSLVTPHAGLQHTYGYLFSTIETKYGKKRDRWVEAHLEHGLGQQADTFGPEPTHGTLLANATWLAGHLAFRDERRLAHLQTRLKPRVAPSLLQVQWSKLSILRFVESVHLFSRDNSPLTISLVTDLLRLPCDNHRLTGNNYLLVYSIRDSRRLHPELITLFLVNETFVGDIEARAKNRRLDDIRPRYNAHVSGFPLTPVVGTCSLTITRG